MTKLAVGDVFVVEKGFRFYGKIPAQFVYSNFNPEKHDKIANSEVIVGEVRPDHTGNGDQFDALDYIGEYVVEAGRMTGGGTGHGPHDVYPNGWRITARQLVDGKYDETQGNVVEFYQSGCFTVMHEDVPVVRTLSRTVSFA